MVIVFFLPCEIIDLVVLPLKVSWMIGVVEIRYPLFLLRFGVSTQYCPQLNVVILLEGISCECHCL